MLCSQVPVTSCCALATAMTIGIARGHGRTAGLEAQNGVPRSGTTKRGGIFSGWGYGCVGILGTCLYYGWILW